MFLEILTCCRAAAVRTSSAKLVVLQIARSCTHSKLQNRKDGGGTKAGVTASSRRVSPSAALPTVTRGPGGEPGRKINEAEPLALKRQRPVSLRPAVEGAGAIANVDHLTFDGQRAASVVAEPDDQRGRLTHPRARVCVGLEARATVDRHHGRRRPVRGDGTLELEDGLDQRCEQHVAPRQLPSEARCAGLVQSRINGRERTPVDRR
eukprot:3891569-Prymnesium_polylepis.1